MQAATLRFWASSFLLILLFSSFTNSLEKEIDLIPISQKNARERIPILEKILSQNSISTQKISLLLLLGKSYLENKDFLKAEKILSERTLFESDLKEYAIYYLISAKSEQNKNSFPEELWEQLAFAEGEPSFRKKALKSLSDYNISLKKWGKASGFLEKLILEEKEDPEILAKAACCYAEMKKENNAYQLAKKLYINYPLNNDSVDFFKRYPLYLERMKDISYEEKKKRLFVLEEAKGFFSLEKEIAEAEKFLPFEEMEFLKASLLSYKGDKFGAITKYLSINPDSSIYPIAILRAAQNISSMSLKTKEIEKKATKLGDCLEKEKALLILFNFYKKNNFESEAKRVARELLKFSNIDASEYLYEKAYENYLSGHKKECTEILKILKQNLPKENDYHQAALFSLIKMDKLGNVEKTEAISELLKFSKYGYYGYKLRNGGMPKIESSGQYLPPYIPNPVPKSRIYKSNLLLESGLTEEAVGEIDAVLAKEEKEEYLWQMALIASRAMAYPKSVRAVRKLYPNAYSQDGDKIPQQAWELLYPLPYFEEFKKISIENKISLVLLLSIARQESLFDRKAVSKANAAGIIQLIPSTAAIAAKKANLPFSSKEQLFDVEYNLKLGSTYFLSIYESFNNNLVSALGGYNAGPLNMKNWRNRPNNPSDEELFIESIPFKETRSYIKRILNNIFEYERIYPELKNAGNRNG